MTQRIVRVSFDNKNDNWSDPAWNKTKTFDPAFLGEVIPNMTDIESAPTGLSLSVTKTCDAAIGSGSHSDGNDYHGWIGLAWYDCWVLSRYDVEGDDGELELAGFPANTEVLLKMAGHINQANKDSIYIVNGGPGVLYDATITPPAPPVEISATSDAQGVITITSDVVSINSYLTAMEIVYDDGVAELTAPNTVEPGVAARITIVGLTPSAANIGLSDGVSSVVAESVTLVSGNDYDVTFPALPSVPTNGTPIQYTTFGNVTMSVGDGVISAEAGTQLVWPLTHINQVVLPSNPSNTTSTGYLFGWAPDNGYEGVQVAAPMPIDDQGNYEAPSEGTYLFYAVDDNDGMLEAFNVVAGSEPEPEPPGDSIGMTRRNITRRAFTRRAQTSRGMTS